jgi:glycosyltransferase involved in cell wall biosynthesis
MKILYVTELWSGLEDLIINGELVSSGMPAFLQPLEYMVKDEKIDVDFIIIGKKPKKLNIYAPWLKRSKFYWVHNRSFLKIFTINKLIKQGNYDFVYGQGEGGAWANLPALLNRVPFGMRYYGTFLSRYLDDNWFRFVLRNPLASLGYNLPKKFMLTTNDGTKGDEVYKKLCFFKNFYRFKFWLNGVNKEKSVLPEEKVLEFLKSIGVTSQTNLIVYPARYDRWKRQHKALEILDKLSHKQKSNIKLLFCGHIYDESYYHELKQMAINLQLEEYVIFNEAIPNDLLQGVFKKSFMVMSLYELSNLGNVVIEASINGSIILTIDDKSTEFLIKNYQTGFAIKDNDKFIPNAVKVIQDLISDTLLKRKIESKMKQHSEDKFLTWKERSELEVALIKKYI